CPKKGPNKKIGAKELGYFWVLLGTGSVKKMMVGAIGAEWGRFRLHKKILHGGKSSHKSSQGLIYRGNLILKSSHNRPRAGKTDMNSRSREILQKVAKVHEGV